MSLSTGQKIAFAVLALGALSVGGYLWWKKKKDETLNAVSPTTSGAQQATQTPVSTPTSQPVNQPTSNTSSLTDVVGFQNWYNSKGFKPKLAADGILGPLTSAAYAKTVVQYLKETKK